MRVDLWSDVSCPWCYIGKTRFEKALAVFPDRDAVEVAHRSFQLNPRLTRTRPAVGMAHAKKYGMTVARIRVTEERLAAMAKKEGLGYLVNFRDHGNTFDLHRLLRLAGVHGLDDELLTLFYEGNFASERSIYDADHQVELAVRAGLDPSEVRAVLADKHAYAEEVRRDEEEGVDLGITGVPFLVIDRRYGVSGAQPDEVFTEALKQAWADRRVGLTALEASDRGRATQTNLVTSRTEWDRTEPRAP
ncbi:DsbA family oxidoreductase [Streptomyces sp. NPDC026673]|uniref:DsbA family oxidoreductase n=1 Tax=Streptomyces sp. NPDC026673 TaxID=3155724 RepID=UPI0034045B3E